MTDTTTAGLLDALLAVQTELPMLPKDKTNPHYQSRYTSLDMVIKTVGPILNAHGLVWTSLPGMAEDTGIPVLTYRLCHVESGEVLEGTMPLMLSKPDSQGQGSALTYARRYSLSAVLNLMLDEDDDGHAASVSGAVSEGPTDRRAPTAKQLTFLKKLIKQHNVPMAALRSHLDAIGAQDVTIEEGWTAHLNRKQVSGLIDTYNNLAVPDPSATDVPADLTDFDAPVEVPAVDGVELPWVDPEQ